MTLSQAFDQLEERYGKGATVILASANKLGNEEVHLDWKGPRVTISLLGKFGVVGICDKRGKE